MTKIIAPAVPAISLEARMMDRGAARYTLHQERASAEGDLTKAEGNLFNQAFDKVLQGVRLAHLDEVVNKGRGKPPVHATALATVDHELLAAIALKATFNAVSNDFTITDLAVHIGKDVEIEMAAAKLLEADKETHKKITKKAAWSAKARAAQAEEILVAAGPDAELDVSAHIHIGLFFFNVVLSSTELFNVPFNSTEGDEGSFDQEGYRRVMLTEAAKDQLDKIDDVQQWMTPVYQAITEKPVAWAGFNTGAYHDQRVAKTVPIMVTFNKAVKAKVDEAAKGNAPFVRALNAIQDVPLSINVRVLEVLEHVFENGIAVGKVPGFKKEMPVTDDKAIKRGIHRDNDKIRAKRQAVQGAINEARIYVDTTFFQPHQLDWRGRVYAKPGFNHQRADFCKGLYDLANGETLDADGVWWLQWHIATTGGFKVAAGSVDKLPNDQRVQWTLDNMAQVEAIAADPIRNLDLWAGADSPFCYLAACCAMGDYLKDPVGYVCHVPVAVDGSCSGLQHFSALLRDVEGGAHVNLVPGAKPADVYAAVAAIVLPLVAQDAAGDDVEVAGLAAKWLIHGIDRKVAKRATMTFVYGSKQAGFASQLKEDIVDTEKGREIFGTEWEQHSAACQYLAKHINTAVQQTVKAAAEAMKWLQDVAGIMARENLPVEWTTPLGLPVVNAYFKPQSKQIKATLWNRALNVPTRFDPKVTTGYTKELVAHKQRNSIAPNFVHSMDSAHLMAVVIKSVEAGINDFLLIHDSFACLPSQMTRFSRIVREAFVELYADNEPLETVLATCLDALMAKAATADAEGIKSIEKNLKALKKIGVPAKGSLKLEDVLESKYAFA